MWCFFVLMIVTRFQFYLELTTTLEIPWNTGEDNTGTIFPFGTYNIGNIRNPELLTYAPFIQSWEQIKEEIPYLDPNGADLKRKKSSGEMISAGENSVSFKTMPDTNKEKVGFPGLYLRPFPNCHKSKGGKAEKHAHYVKNAHNDVLAKVVNDQTSSEITSSKSVRDNEMVGIPGLYLRPYLPDCEGSSETRNSFPEMPWETSYSTEHGHGVRTRKSSDNSVNTSTNLQEEIVGVPGLFFHPLKTIFKIRKLTSRIKGHGLLHHPLLQRSQDNGGSHAGGHSNDPIFHNIHPQTRLYESTPVYNQENSHNLEYSLHGGANFAENADVTEDLPVPFQTHNLEPPLVFKFVQFHGTNPFQLQPCGSKIIEHTDKKPPQSIKTNHIFTYFLPPCNIHTPISRDDASFYPEIAQIESVPENCGRIFVSANETPNLQSAIVGEITHITPLTTSSPRTLFWRSLSDKTLQGIHSGNQKKLDNIKRSKRQAPLVELFTNPNAELDVPKTLQNVGTIARNTFEHPVAPLYHVKNALSSAKDAMMSGLKIPQQNFILPSKYKIVNAETDTQKSSDATNLLAQDPTYVLDMYQKIGNMLRDSVRSGQNALEHLAEVAQNTRKAINAARSFTPRFAQTNVHLHPFLERLNNNTQSKLLIVTPKVLELKHDEDVVGSPRYLQTNNDFVGIGHIFDGLGISNPAVQRVGLVQTTLYPKPPAITPRKLRQYVILRDKLRARDAQEIENALTQLDNVKRVFGATSLKDFLSKIKLSSPNTLRKKLEDARNRVRVNVFPVEPKNDASKDRLKSHAETNVSEIVGATSSPSVSEPLTPNIVSSDNEDEDQELGAINPLMYQKIFNETLEAAQPPDLTNIAKRGTPDLYEIEDFGGEPLGISMNMGKKLVTPFMGKVEQEVVDVFYDDYQHDHRGSLDNYQEMYLRENEPENEFVLNDYII